MWQRSPVRCSVAATVFTDRRNVIHHFLITCFMGRGNATLSSLNYGERDYDALVSKASGAYAAARSDVAGQDSRATAARLGSLSHWRVSYHSGWAPCHSEALSFPCPRLGRSSRSFAHI